MMSPWIPVGVGILIQALILAFFMGKMREQQNTQTLLFQAYQRTQSEVIESIKTHFSETMAQLGHKMEAFDAFANGSSLDRSRLTGRLDQVEKNTESLASMRIEMARDSATQSAEHRALKERMDGLERGLRNNSAQLANLVAGRDNRFITMEPNT